VAAVARGEPAPDFELEGTDAGGRRQYRLSEYLGLPVVLVFYPGDNTPVCTAQLTRYTADFPTLARTGAQVLALSPQSVESHERFAERQGGFAFPLLADLEKTVGRAYGIVGPLGFYRRSAFVVDREGLVAWSSRSITGLSFPSPTDLAEALLLAEG
jgi:peroxiredoxin